MYASRQSMLGRTDGFGQSTSTTNKNQQTQRAAFPMNMHMANGLASSSRASSEGHQRAACCFVGCTAFFGPMLLIAGIVLLTYPNDRNALISEYNARSEAFNESGVYQWSENNRGTIDGAVTTTHTAPVRASGLSDDVGDFYSTFASVYIPFTDLSPASDSAEEKEEQNANTSIANEATTTGQLSNNNNSSTSQKKPPPLGWLFGPHSAATNAESTSGQISHDMSAVSLNKNRVGGALTSYSSFQRVNNLDSNIDSSSSNSIISRGGFTQYVAPDTVILRFQLNSVIPFTRVITPTITQTVIMTCNDKHGCPAADMAAQCQSTRGDAASYDGTGCVNAGMCGICRFPFYLQIYCAVATPIIPLPPEDEGFAESDHYRSCLYPFTDADLQQYYGPNRPQNVEFRVMKKHDPYLLIQELTRGSMDFGFSAVVLRHAGTTLAILGSITICIMIVAAVYLRRSLKNSRKTGFESDSSDEFENNTSRGGEFVGSNPFSDGGKKAIRASVASGRQKQQKESGSAVGNSVSNFLAQFQRRTHRDDEQTRTPAGNNEYVYEPPALPAAESRSANAAQKKKKGEGLKGLNAANSTQHHSAAAAATPSSQERHEEDLQRGAATVTTTASGASSGDSECSMAPVVVVNVAAGPPSPSASAALPPLMGSGGRKENASPPRNTEGDRSTRGNGSFDRPPIAAAATSSSTAATQQSGTRSRGGSAFIGVNSNGAFIPPKPVHGFEVPLSFSRNNFLAMERKTNDLIAAGGGGGGGGVSNNSLGGRPPLQASNGRQTPRGTSTPRGAANPIPTASGSVVADVINRVRGNSKRAASSGPSTSQRQFVVPPPIPVAPTTSNIGNINNSDSRICSSREIADDAAH